MATSVRPPVGSDPDATSPARFLSSLVDGAFERISAFESALAKPAPRSEADPWQASIAAFVAEDRLHPPMPGGVVVVGSSSVRLWDSLETSFPGNAVIRRGFGGSNLTDCLRHVDELVLPARPRRVIVYAGDNDLAAGASPDEVFRTYKAFVARVQAALPETRIAFMSIKPSPSRLTMRGRVIATNALIERYTRTDPRLEYIEIYSKMVDARGIPRLDLYQGDMLHPNAAGYALWNAAIADYL